MSHPWPLVTSPYGKPSSSFLLRSFQTFRDIPKQVVIRAVKMLVGTELQSVRSSIVWKVTSAFRMSRVIEVRFVMSVSKHRPVRAKATIICTHNDKVLLVRRKCAKWKFPSGALAAGEAPIVAAARELWSELSLHCSGLHGTGTVQVGKILHHLFSTEVPDGCRVVLGKRIEACRWVEWAQLSPTMFNPTAAALLSKDLSSLAPFDQQIVE